MICLKISRSMCIELVARAESETKEKLLHFFNLEKMNDLPGAWSRFYLRWHLINIIIIIIVCYLDSFLEF